MLKSSFPGHNHFDPTPMVIRDGAVLTTNYVLCADYTPDNGIPGDIPIEFASRATFWGTFSFGSTPATSIEIKPVFTGMPKGKRNVIADVSSSGVHEGADIFLGDLASTAATLVVTSATGGFEPWMTGHYLVINSGTNFTPGRYLITAYTSATSITVSSDPTSGGNGSSGIGGIAVEFQEASMSTASGVTSLTPHLYTFAAASLTGAGTDDQNGAHVCWTAPLPAASIMRVYAKCTGTATATNLILGVTLMPPEGA